MQSEEVEIASDSEIERILKLEKINEELDSEEDD